MRLGSGQKEGQLSAGTILPHQGSPWPEEGDSRSRGLDADCHLSHAQGWNALPGPRPQLPRSPVHRPAKKASGQTTGRSRLRCGTDAARRLNRACGTAGEPVARSEQVSFFLGAAGAAPSVLTFPNSPFCSVPERKGKLSEVPLNLLSFQER